MKKLTFGNAIICEFATPSERSKLSLINIFSGDIIIGAVPVQLRLALYIEYILEENGADKIMLDIMLNDKKIGTLTVTTSKSSPSNVFPIVMNGVEILIDKESTLTIVAYADGYERVRVLSKKISVGDLAS